MFSKEELEKIIEGKDRVSRYFAEKKRTVGSSSKKRFAGSFLISIGLLGILLSLVLSQAIAIQLAAVGGFTADIDRIEGDDIALYPDTAETSACPGNFQSDGTASTSGLPLYTADIGAAQIPEGERVTFRKDIATPRFAPMDAVRLSLTNQPLFQDTDTDIYPTSGGGTTDEHIHAVEFNQLSDTYIENYEDEYLDRTSVSESPEISADGGSYTDPDGWAHDGDYVHDNAAIQEGTSRTYTYSAFDSTADIQMHLRNGEHTADGSIENEVYEFDERYSTSDGEEVKIEVDYTDPDEVEVDVNNGDLVQTYDASGDGELYWSTYEWAGTTGDNSLRLHEPYRGTPVYTGNWYQLEVTYDTQDFDHYVRAFIDWNGDGTFDQVEDVGNSDTGIATDSTWINIPDDADMGSTVMRVSQKYNDWPEADEDFSFGQVADYRLNVYHGGDTELGDASLSFTELQGDVIDIQTNVVMDDRATTDDPFGRHDGELIIEGEDAFIEEGSARVHFLSFAELALSNLQMEIVYDPPNPQVAEQDYCDLNDPRIDVHIVDWDRTVDEGQTMEVTAEFINPGNPEDPDSSIGEWSYLYADGSFVESEYISLDAGETETHTYTWDTTGETPQDYEMEVDVSDQGEDTVLAGVEGMRIIYAGDGDEVEAGTDNDVWAYVRNDGMTTQSNSVYCYVDSSQTDGFDREECDWESEEVTREPNEAGWTQIGTWEPDCSIGDETIDMRMRHFGDDSHDDRWDTDSFYVDPNDGWYDPC